MSFSIELPQTYTFSLFINQGDRTLVDTTVEVNATAEGIAKAKRTIQCLMDEYAPAIETPQAAALEPVPPEPNTGSQAPINPTDLPDPETASVPPPEKKPEGVRGLIQLHCKECGRTFGTYLREPQTEVLCKCGHPIDLTGQMGKYRFTCPYCEKETWGRTNLEDPDITVRCKCGGDVDLHWVPKAREYQN